MTDAINFEIERFRALFPHSVVFPNLDRPNSWFVKNDAWTIHAQYIVGPDDHNYWAVSVSSPAFFIDSRVVGRGQTIHSAFMEYKSVTKDYQRSLGSFLDSVSHVTKDKPHVVNQHWPEESE